MKKKENIQDIFKGDALRLTAYLALLLVAVSCDYIHDKLPLCRHTLRFVYYHNIKHADAFA